MKKNESSPVPNAQDGVATESQFNATHLAKHIHDSICHPTYSNLDPSFSLHYKIESSFHVSSHSINDHFQVRVLPRIHGYPVINADRIFLIHKRSGDFTNLETGGDLDVKEPWTQPSTNLSKSQALKIVRKFSGHSAQSTANGLLKFSVLDSESSELHYSSNYVAEQVYFAEHSILKEIRPAWRIIDYNEPLLSRHLWYVDASTGQILQSQPTIWFGHGRGYKFDIKKPSPPKTPFTDINIPNIYPRSPYNDGKGVYGRDFRSMNTCFGYKCSNSSLYGKAALNGTCNENESICVDITPDMKEGKDYFSTTYSFVVDGKYIELDKDWEADGFFNGQIYMEWDRAAVMAPRLSVSPGGGYNMELDEKTYFGTEFNDAFSEFQAVYFADLQVQYFRELVGDENFCLIGRGPNCTLTDTKLNRTGTPVDSPLKIITNLQTVRAHPSSNSPYPDLFTQLSQGYGKSPAFPIRFRDAESYGDAFFSNNNRQIPGLFVINNSSEGEVTYGFRDSRDCSKGQCLSTFSTTYDFIAMGQNEQYDWALNDCIVMHEVTHVLIGKLIPDLPSYVWTKDGLSSDPGAMNEAWADYFGAARCGLSNFRESYNGRPLRNLLNSFTCKNAVGEPHADGQIFGGALWAVRAKIPTIPTLNYTHQIEFDKLILNAIAQGQPTDLFATQLNRVISLLSTHPVLSKTPLLQFAKDEFDKRVIKCDREMKYDGTMDTTFSLPTSTLTAANLSTLPVPLYVKPRKSDWGFKFEWKQYYISPILGQIDFGYARSPLSAYVSNNCPIRFKQSSTTITAESVCRSQSTPIPEIYTTHTPSTGMGSLEQFFTPGDVDKIYVWFGHQVPAYIVMYSTTVVCYGWNRIWIIYQIVSGGFGLLVSLLWIWLNTWKVVRKRGRNQAMVASKAVVRRSIESGDVNLIPEKVDDFDTRSETSSVDSNSGISAENEVRMHILKKPQLQKPSPTTSVKDSPVLTSERFETNSGSGKYDGGLGYQTVEDKLREEEGSKWSIFRNPSLVGAKTASSRQNSVRRGPSLNNDARKLSIGKGEHSGTNSANTTPNSPDLSAPKLAIKEKPRGCCRCCSIPAPFTVQMMLNALFSCAIFVVALVGLIFHRFSNPCLLATFLCGFGNWFGGLMVWIWVRRISSGLNVTTASAIPVQNTTVDNISATTPTEEENTNTENSVTIQVPNPSETGQKAITKPQYSKYAFIAIACTYLLSLISAIVVTGTLTVMLGSTADVDPSTGVQVFVFTVHLLVFCARWIYIFRSWGRL
ncbi:hypothetical protein HK098_005151 [Nowakowskiella sp. JEL0407]|nr:hypothetical protein HK098_005151 [Nowakowskiella sp. JEL0407]